MIEKYILIIAGLILIAFNRDFVDAYEEFAINYARSKLPRIITATRLLIGGLVLTGLGIYQLIEQM